MAPIADCDIFWEQFWYIIPDTKGCVTKHKLLNRSSWCVLMSHVQHVCYGMFTNPWTFDLQNITWNMEFVTYAWFLHTRKFLCSYMVLIPGPKPSQQVLRAWILTYIMPTNDTNYNCHIKYLTTHMGSISHHIMPLVINSLRAGHTNTHTYWHSQTKQF